MRVALFKAVLRQILLAPRRPEARSAPATDADVYFCYRLLLRRKPDPDGWAYWTQQVKERGLDVRALRDEFLYGAEFMTTQSRYAQQVVNLDDFTMVVWPNDRSVGMVVTQTGQYEPHVSAALRAALKPGHVFLDIGANIGYFTLLAATLVGKAGRVIACEPNRDNVSLIQRSCALNSFEQVELHRVAVGERAGEMQLLVDKAGSDGILLDAARAASAESHRLQTAQVVALDDYLPPLPRLDVVKMDIEGSEPAALAGMRRLIETHRPVIFTEFNPTLIEAISHTAPETYLDGLRASGYELGIVESSEPVAFQPRDNQSILRAYQASGSTHLDLIATPADIERTSP